MKLLGCCALILGLAVGGVSGIAFAQQSKSKNVTKEPVQETPMTGVKSRNVIFDITDDRKIEVKGGLQEPEGLDKYMRRKFDAVDEQFKQLNQKLDKIQVQIDDIHKRMGQ
jgi:esterase/lipase